MHSSSASNAGESLAELGDWYHQFDSLGVHVTQRPGIYARNQVCKESTIMEYMRAAFDACTATSACQPSALELYCADGYYACHARRMGAGRVEGIDLDERAIRQAQAVWRVLYGDGQTVFRIDDVRSFTPERAFDIVLCCGGLYHMSDPQEIIDRCSQIFSERFLIVQSVVTMEADKSDDSSYFAAPAPGWQHGCRFSAPFLRNVLEESGWAIVDSYLNELEGNERLCAIGALRISCMRSRA